MSAFSKRFPFKRSSTSGVGGPGEGEITVNETTSSEDAVPSRNVRASSNTTGSGTDVELEAADELHQLEKNHKWDPNMPSDLTGEIDEATANHDTKAELGVLGEISEDSIYPEVRAAVRPYDEDLPANTIRAWTLGMILVTIASGLNALFSLRAPAIVISSLVVQLVSYPLGCAWAAVVPSRKFHIGRWSFSFNPGPFNIKEHTLIVVMANVNVAGGAAYATDTITAMQGFYGQKFGWGWNLLLCWSTQMIGYGLAGITRKLLVFPAAMIWPTTLVNASLFHALHDHSKTDPAKANGWTIGRYRYFLYVFGASFVWYWFPGFIAPFLSVFSFVVWIRPNNVVINQLFGGWTGLSLIPITFDWTQIAGYAYSPLIPPAHAIANTLIGVVLFFWFVTMGLSYTGKWYADYLPISDSNSYDNTGNNYNVTKILTPEFTLALNAYENYSPLFLSTTFALCYGLSFASIAATIVHVPLFHGKDIWQRLRSLKGSDDDVHYRLMLKYKSAPGWWYLATFLIMLGMGFATSLAWPTHLSWWAYIVSLIIAIVWFVPIGVIQGITSIQIGLNVFTEFLVGYIQPGKPVAMMLFKTYGYITMAQGLYFAQDLKLGQYMKVPQRTMFWGQTVATLWACVVQVGVLQWALDHIDGVCDEHQSNHFTCPNGRVFFNASVIWGLIGPQRIFSPGSIYSSLQYFWLAGALAPILAYFGARMFPKSPIKYLSFPIIFGGSGQIPPATPLNYLSWGVVGLIFNKYIRNKYRGWWMRFNYITSAGLDVGLAISTIVIICALNLTNTNMPSWWGTSVATDNLDYADTAIRIPNPNGPDDGRFFGPLNW